MSFEKGLAMYPKYPEASLLGVASDKLKLAELMQIWDKYGGVLPLLPKTRSEKYPHYAFWRKSGELYGTIPDRNLAEEFQLRGDVSGWSVATGREDSRILVIDFDPATMTENPLTVYERIQGLSPTEFVLRTPSNGVHLYYRIPDGWELPSSSARNMPEGVDIRCVGGNVAFIGGVNTYTGKKAEAKGVADGYRATYTEIPYGRYVEVPNMTEALYNLITHVGVPDIPRTNIESAHSYGVSQQGIERLQAHFEQPQDKRVAITAEALNKALANWNGRRSYEEWCQVWMSAHHGSDGSPIVRDILLSHPEVAWYTEDERQEFIRRWDEHIHREEGGYTVASLFWHARNEGWLTTTGYEINEDRMRKIDTRYISDWLDTLEEVPKRLMLMSQTGSGKTYAIKRLYERLGSPKTVIFVPTRKLATELAMTLAIEHGLPVTLYRETDTGEIVNTELLAKAQVLVTTLQTFATKLDMPMERYGLVYVEESDQLLAQFARGGGGSYTSHVDDKQARKGYAKVREAVEKSGVVWFVDATMSKVTQTVVETMYEGHVAAIKNVRVQPKPTVEILPEKAQAYQAVVKALVAGQRVVVCADTAREAEVVADIASAVGALKGKKALTITRRTENNPEVRRFMENVNERAKEYQLVTYNSVMASGVSITSVRPDLVVQIATYLTPRVNLQILNRYRKQQRVVCYYQSLDRVYQKSADEIMRDMATRANVEGMLINMGVAERVPDALLREQVAAISIADDDRQMRTPRDFYVALLQGDGRRVVYNNKEEIYGRVGKAIEAIKEARKQEAELIARTWVDVPPIDEHRPPEPGLSAVDMAKGEVHAWIERTLRGNIPKEVPPEEIYETVKEFSRHGFILTAFVRQQLALKRAEFYLADDGRSLLNLSNYVTTIRLLTVVSKLYKSVDEVLTREVVEARADAFMNALILAQESYDAAITRSRQKFAEVYHKHEDNPSRALAFVKILLSQIGLKQRVKRKKVDGEVVYNYHIANVESARNFLRWRNADDPDFEPTLTFDDSAIVEAVERRKSAFEVYKDMQPNQKKRVFELVDNLNDFTKAVKIVEEGEGVW